MSSFSMRRIAGAASVAGIATLAMVANPALGSAAVTGSSTVTNSAGTITVALHDIATTEALNHCEAQIFPFDAAVYDKTTRVDEITYPGFTGGAATGTSIALKAGTYAVITQCKEGASTNPYVKLGSVAKVTLAGDPTNPGGGTGSADFSPAALLQLLGFAS
ncbi:hypothetical protein [Rhodococcus sp. NPDC127528]|uniref:hypothetical protein n=1 Tax=unclassified Rhodococcus (in: high G+C Gram-positive bacteria) TaxID=192944 RepID=UPI00363ABAD1